MWRTTAHHKLFQQSFAKSNLPNAQVASFTYNFTANDLAVLSAYFLNDSKIAFGFDPDCHFWNNGVTFTMQTTPNTPTPEPATLLLLGTGISGVAAKLRKRRKANKI
ncbi:MAG: PEP-CTERM sorting domain-containing protein [Acidobacteriota bacterium]|nr:PEP-CTERM sorting domain-containing protein [Acidobacteriota bacterium]